MAALIVAGCEGERGPVESPVAPATPPPTASRPAASSSPAPTPVVPPAPRTLTIAFVGDLMLDRDVEHAMATEGAGYPFERVRPLFDGADLIVANLEGTFADAGEPLDKFYVFATDPTLASGLADLPIWGVSLSNNHATDYGLPGLERTIETLDAHDIRHFGAGMTEAEARAALLTTTAPGAGQPTIAFLGYSDIGETIFAEGGSGGVSRATLEAIATDVAAARDNAGVDFVVVTLHMGTEYTHVVNARQRELAEAAIDAGADLVVGHHPHVLQPVEEYATQDGREGLILYSLGNFVFDLDAEDMQDLGEGPFQSVVALVTFEVGAPLSVELRPARIDVTENRPRPATPEEATAILDLLAGH